MVQRSHDRIWFGGVNVSLSLTFVIEIGIILNLLARFLFALRWRRHEEAVELGRLFSLQNGTNIVSLSLLYLSLHLKASRGKLSHRHWLNLWNLSCVLLQQSFYQPCMIFVGATVANPMAWFV